MTEKLYDLPIAWEWTTIDGIGQTFSGGTPSTSDESNFNGNIPWITPADLTGYTAQYISKGRKNISQKGLNASSAKMMPTGAVLFSSRAPIGYVVIAANPLSTNQGFKSIKPADEIESLFVYYYLKSAKRLAESRASGTTFRELSGSRFNKLPIPIAPQNEQKRIIDKIETLFSDLDEGEMLLRNVQKQLATYRQSVLKAAVTGELTKKWREKNKRRTESGSSLLQRILKSRRESWKGRGKYEEAEAPKNQLFSDIPDLWTIATIDQISSAVDYGSSAKCTTDDRGVAVLRMGNIQDGVLDLEDLKYLPKKHEEFPRLLLSNGDLLFNRTNSAELVGKTAVYRGKPQSCSFASYLIRVKLIESEPEYISAFINSAYGKTWIKAVVSQQVGQANVNGTKLKALAVPLPPKEEQEEIVQLMADIFSKISALENWCATEIQRSNTLRQSILKSAFSGKLVPQDPADEPASALLARIQSMHAQPTAASSARQSRKSKASEAA